MPYSIRIAIRVLLIEDTVRVLCRLFTTCKYINRIIFILFYVQHVSTILDIRRAWFPLSNRHMKWMWSIECQHLIIKNEKENDCIDLEVSYFFKVTGAFLLFNFLFFQVVSLSLIVFFYTSIEITVDHDDDEEDMRTSELRITRQTYTHTRLDKTCKANECCTFFYRKSGQWWNTMYRHIYEFYWWLERNAHLYFYLNIYEIFYFHVNLNFVILS
jgi:hypothetical protein